MKSNIEILSEVALIWITREEKDMKYILPINYTEFGEIENQAGVNRFIMYVGQWIERTRAKGMLVKVNYRKHTDAIKENLIPAELSKQQINAIDANEADLLNVALFGTTAQHWRTENPKSEGNIRDYANIEQLVVLSNMESINVVLIHQGLPNSIKLLNKIPVNLNSSNFIENGI